jgi:hypothetical protein
MPLDNEIHQVKQKKKSLNNFISIACSSTIVSDYFEEKKRQTVMTLSNQQFQKKQSVVFL